ncbi:hypothetical protein [Sulfitobacter sp. M13]
MISFLTGVRAKLAVATSLTQLTNFLVLLVAKTALTETDFKFLLVQLSIAGIIGVVASMRLEVLIFQKFERETYAGILTPTFFIAITIAVSFLCVAAIDRITTSSLTLSFLTIPILVGLAISSVQNFIFVQAKRLHLLLATRFAQATASIILIIGIMNSDLLNSGDRILFVLGLSVALPSTISLIYYVWCIPSGHVASPKFYFPDLKTAKRATWLTASTGVNSAYLNIPLLFAAATQTASFVADFGLFMRALAAPVTLVGQVTGRLFLADALKWSITSKRQPSILIRLISRAMAESVGFYIVVASALICLLWLLREPLLLTHFTLIYYLFAAAMGQSAINPVSQVRVPLREERIFLALDIARLSCLSLGLYLLAPLLSLELSFAIISLVLYSAYTGFIFQRVLRLPSL